jgi:hypothetical protein
MNSGRWDENGKIRPGTYINVDATGSDSIQRGTRGVVLIPLIGNGWGADKSVVTVKASRMDAEMAKLGFKPSENILTKQALLNAATVLLYIINSGTKATVTTTLVAATDDDPAVTLTSTAKYEGTTGNTLKVSCAANADSTFDVTVFLGTEAVETFRGLSTCQDLKDAGSEYIDFTGSDLTHALVAFSSATLTGGTTTTPVTADFTAFLDALENIKCNAVALPTTEAGLITAAISKVKYLRDDIGKTVVFVVPNQAAGTANYEGLVNVVNSVILEDGTTVTIPEVTAFVAGACAGASELISNTGLVHPLAVDISGALGNEAAEQAILDGKMFFSFNNDNDVAIEYDINSLHTFTDKRTKDYRKNKVIRVFDAVTDAIRATFPPNRFENSKLGWDRVDGLGQVLLRTFSDDEGGEGAITEVDYSNDFLVDREKSEGDSMYINVGIKAVDMAEKLYFQVNTR